MKLILLSIASRPPREQFRAITAMYLERLKAYSPYEDQTVRSEAAFFQAVEKHRARTSPLLVLLDARGKSMTSEGFAVWIGQQRDAGQQSVIFAIGPADGWSEAARGQANLLLSLGSMILPHELAKVVLAEQVYRAFTILAGHPYHSGH